MQQDLTGYTPPESWDAGIPALFIDYTSNFYYSKTGDTSNSNAYLSTNTG